MSDSRSCTGDPDVAPFLMPRYDRNGIAFDPPPHWIDKTIVAFAASEASENTPNIIMTEEALDARDTLRDRAERLLSEFACHLSAFDVLENEATTVGGLPAIFMRFSWVSQLGGLEQSMTLVERRASGRRTLLTFMGTSRGEEAPHMRSIFAQTLRTVRFGDTRTKAVALLRRSS